MSNIKNIELYDDIRNDALILMGENPNLQYQEAFKQAKENLIGDINICDFEFKPFNVEIDSELNNIASRVDSNKDDYYTSVRNKLAEYINVEEFTEAQLEEYNIAIQMGVDITKFADNNFSPSQIKTLCLLVASGKDIDKYRYDYDFDPKKIVEEMIAIETKK